MKFWHSMWGHRIQGEREARGWSRAELAERLGVTEQTVNRWERGVLGISDRHKIKIAELFDRDVRNIFPLERGGPC